ncbi:MAG: hemin ABC transporter substrate-binding protein, partial [Hyphomicrobium sp.]
MAILRVRASAYQLLGAAALVALCAMPLRAQETTKTVDTSRILSIGGDVTEILYALKADGKIIAVDATSQFPAEAL